MIVHGGNDIARLTVLDEKGGSIFGTGKYVVPVYQREFAWGEKEIAQLIEDVNDFEGKEYCLGTLVVDVRDDGAYEVIDGQQRLTALFLLLAALGIDVKGEGGISLSYECRDSSNKALDEIQKLVPHFGNECRESSDKALDALPADGKDGEGGLFAAFRTVRDILARMNVDAEGLKEKLKGTVIFRVQVPAKTDRNRYFEVMNTRGEQLEPADLVKADLMGMLTRESDRSKAAEIWQACSDMTGYVQMHFPAERRKRLFGERWDKLPSVAWESGDASDDAAARAAEGGDKSIKDILSQKSAQEYAAAGRDDADDSEAAYVGVIGFTHFLLHTFKVYACTHGCEAGKGDLSVTKDGQQVPPGMLDDGKLKQTFDALKRECYGAGGKEEKAKFAREFVECMLCCRVLFDDFIVKREKRGSMTDDSEVNDGGAWSLKRFVCNGGKRGTRKGYCVNTFRADGRKKKNREADDPEERQVKLQACLRVSYTSPKVMHWITRALLFLHEKAFHYDENGVRYTDFADIASLADALVEGYERCLESVAQEGVKAAEGFEEWINSEGGVPALGVPALGVPALGVATPNIVFNYLDYILWRDRVWKEQKSNRKNARTYYELKYPEVRYDDFDFTFRTSVEHFYPRHPKNGEKWEGGEGGGVDNFGNLAILSRSKNSSFSNSLPSAKNVDNSILSSSAFSLKLRVMAAMLKENKSVDDADAWWREGGSRLHAEEMRGLLKEAFARLRPKNVK